MNGGRSLDYVLPLLGARTYLHGTTLFDTLLQHVPPEAAVSFTISKRIDTDRVAFLTEPPINQSDAAHAKLSWRADALSGLIAVMPLAPSAEPRRTPYDEALVTRALVYGDQSVTMEKASPFSFVATLIPMFKALLANCVNLANAGQWMFTRLDVKLPTEGSLPLHLRYEGMLGHSLARGAIERDRQKFGTLYFSWVPAAGGPLSRKAAS